MSAPPMIPMVWRIRQVLALAAVVEHGGQTSLPYTHARKNITCALMQPQKRTLTRTHTHSHTHRATMTNIVPLGRHRLGSKVSSVSINREWCDWLHSDSMTAASFDWFKPELPPLTNFTSLKKKHSWDALATIRDWGVDSTRVFGTHTTMITWLKVLRN